MSEKMKKPMPEVEGVFEGMVMLKKVFPTNPRECKTDDFKELTKYMEEEVTPHIACTVEIKTETAMAVHMSQGDTILMKFDDRMAEVPKSIDRKYQANTLHVNDVQKDPNVFMNFVIEAKSVEELSMVDRGLIWVDPTRNGVIKIEFGFNGAVTQEELQEQILPGVVNNVNDFLAGIDPANQLPTEVQ